MFMHIVTQVSGRLMALYTQVLASLKELLFKPARHLLVSFILAFPNAVSLLCRVARTALNTKAWLVSLITQVLSTSRALISVKVKALLLGLQRLITVPQTLQPAPTTPSRKRGRPVGSTKSARSRSKGNKTAPTHTAHQSTQAGSKSQGHAKQPRQRAMNQSKKGH